MADKPKTYPQQIQELKSQLTAAQEEKNKALEQISLLPELQQELQHLREQVENSSSGDQLAFATNKAQTTDMQQQIDSNAQLARTYSKANQELKIQVEQLESQLEQRAKQKADMQDLEKKLELTAEALKTANLRVTTVSQRLKDAVGERDAVIENQSRELQSLRMNDVGQRRLLAELTLTISEAPDTLALLKQIAGLPNGKSTI